MTPIKAAAGEVSMQQLEAAARVMSDAPAGNAGVRDEQVEIACAAYAKATDYYVEFHRGLSSVSSDEMRKGMRAALAALALPQPREALADEIKRADAGPPEASFDNASDMLGYLNAPAREAEPVTPITNPLVLPAGIKAGDYASPSPTPEAPGGREEIARLLERVTDVLSGARSVCVAGSAEDDRWDVAKANLLEDIRAVKPQDGGDCEHGIAKVNCGICVPSKVFSKPQDGGESGR